MSRRQTPECSSSSSSARAHRARQERRLRHSPSQGHRRMDISTMHSSIRRPSFSYHTISSAQFQPLDSLENRSSSPQSNPDQDQFIDGQPTASLNSQRPGFVRTFSRSGLQYRQYDAETIPNIAYIERTASMASQDARRRLQALGGGREAAGEEDRADIKNTASNAAQPAETDDTNVTKMEGWPSFPPHHSPHLTLEATATRNSTYIKRLAQKRGVDRASLFSDAQHQSEQGQEQSIAQILEAASEPSEPLETRIELCNGLLSHGKVSAESFSSDGARQNITSNEPNLECISSHISTSATLKEVDERDEEALFRAHDEGARLARVYSREREIGGEDYFGDSIEGEEALIPPIPPRSPFRSRSSTPEIGVARAVRLFPTNPDPPSGSTTQDDLPIRPLPLDVATRHPSYRYREPVQPATRPYPSPLRHQSLHRSSTTRTGRTQGDKQNHERRPSHDWDSRRHHCFSISFWKATRDRPVEAPENQAGVDFFRGLLHDNAPSHWALYGIHGFIWFALTGYFFWRVSQIGNKVAFDCYELKAQLLHLSENMTSLIRNSTIGDIIDLLTNETAFGAIHDDKPRNASSIIGPNEFQAILKGHCILQPVRRAVVLALHFEVWFLGMVVTCGLAYMVEVLVLTQLRTWLVKSGPQGKKKLLVRIGVRTVAAGIASMLVAGTTWAMKDGW